MTACRQGVARLSQATSAVAGDFMSSGSLGTVAPTIADIVPYAGRVLERDAFRRNRKGDSFFCANQIHHSGR
ncbi:hypothetical protein CN116_30120 [Sinorhizobium meliloti]|nr:hypothetical protein CN125_32540 [Sinorhizobium meliloti]RVM40450.1 hypothetical protein CN121_31160 [Sinorhizobium meliloti]RVM55670.1 hypothetical protein CN124_32550 [Sinorhizobium meliloti]RVM59930.1 hypothetical protein CN123_31535 [Sinorhizobium meliloti]RVM76379.1 hypothetical protein CN117_31585 [Sinorhizobium meliloti]